MTAVFAIMVGVLVGSAICLLRRRSLLGIVLGIILLGQGANLGVFAAAGPVRGVPPLVLPGQTAPPEGAGDPVSQALVLTAIVIGFAVSALVVGLVIRAARASATDDVEETEERVRAGEGLP